LNDEGDEQCGYLLGAILMDILKQQEISDEWRKKLYRSVELSEEIEPEVSRSRYPGVIEDKLWLPFEEYNRRDAERAEEKAEVVLSITKGTGFHLMTNISAYYPYKSALYKYGRTIKGIRYFLLFQTLKGAW